MHANIIYEISYHVPSNLDWIHFVRYIHKLNSYGVVLVLFLVGVFGYKCHFAIDGYIPRKSRRGHVPRFSD